MSQTHCATVLPRSIVAITALLTLAAWSSAAGEPAALPSQEGDYLARDFHFASGATLPELRLHYTTIGAPTSSNRSGCAAK